MRLKTLILIAAAITTLSGCASRTDVERNGVQLKSFEEQLTALDMRTQRLEQARQAKAEKSRSEFCFSNNLT